VDICRLQSFLCCSEAKMIAIGGSIVPREACDTERGRGSYT
jgi:hypothetical protein